MSHSSLMFIRINIESTSTCEASRPSETQDRDPVTQKCDKNHKKEEEEQDGASALVSSELIGWVRRSG